MNDASAEKNDVGIEPGDAVTEAVRRGVRGAVLTHAKLGRAVPVSRGGEVVWVSPEEILAPNQSLLDGRERDAASGVEAGLPRRSRVQ